MAVAGKPILMSNRFANADTIFARLKFDANFKFGLVVDCLVHLILSIDCVHVAAACS